MSNCPVCNTPLQHTEGRRPKKYCSPACRIKAWQSKKSEERKPILEEGKTYRIVEGKPVEVKFAEATKKSFDGSKKGTSEHIKEENSLVEPSISEPLKHSDFDYFLSVAKDKSFEDIEAFKVAVMRSKLTPNQKAMVVAKANN